MPILGLALGPACFFAVAEGMPALRGSAATTYLKQKGIYNSLGEAVEAAMYRAHPDKAGLGFAAPNPRHDFVARFSASGLRIDGAGWQSAWRLRSVGYGGWQVAVGPARLEADGPRIELRRGAGVTEWYVNSVRGLEQGFTLQRPAIKREAGERLRVSMEVLGDLKAQEAGEEIELTRADGTVALRYEHLVVKDAKGRELAARMGVGEGSVWVEVEDSGAVWPVTVDPTFAQQAYLKASNAEVGEAFGISVAVSGNTVVVGAMQESSNAVGVNGDQFNNSAGNSGAAYVFVRNGNTWSQQAYLKASNPEGYDIFGVSVAVSGDTIVIGASGEDSNAVGVNGDQMNNSLFNAGAAYVFVRNGVTWSQQAYLKATNTGANLYFGLTVAVSGETVVVGSMYESSGATGVNGNQTDNSAAAAGAAYIFVRNGVTWSPHAYLKASNTRAGDQFGSSVAVSGDTVVISAPREGSLATGVNGDQTNTHSGAIGAAYIFVRDGVTWSQQAYLKASTTAAGDVFGSAVSALGDVVVVGAAGEGVAHVFVRKGVVWLPQAVLKVSDSEDDSFGSAVAVSGDVIVVGAHGDDSSATGVNSGQSDNNARDSGAAYAFVRNGVTWSQRAYLKASNTQPGDLFGTTVAASGGTIVVGAFLEDSSGRGVNGDQNGTTYNSGAVYVFSIGPVLITDIRSITDFGDVPNFASGSWLQITGIGLAQATRGWQASDFNANNAPTSLGGVSVFFNGKPGFVSFTKPDDAFGPSQINVQAPADAATGTVQIVVRNSAGTSEIFVAERAALAPGMLAPAKFNVGGKQYLVATYGTDYLFVGNENLLPGAPFRPAKPGDTLYLYGVGFGDSTPHFAPGVIPTVLTQLNAQVQFQFGPALVTPYYAGFYPNFIGLDLFGLVVPNVPDGDHLITVLVNGQPLAQTLYLTVKR